jgi:hypothetical protein
MAQTLIPPRSNFGCLAALVFLIALLAGWYFLVGPLATAEKAVENAHRKWASNDTRERIEAVKEYEDLLKRTDRFDPSRRWVRDDRDTLYRRVIVFEFKFQRNPEKAREYILEAWDEGIRDLRIEEEDVREYWDKAVAPLKEKDKIKDKNS